MTGDGKALMIAVLAVVGGCVAGLIVVLAILGARIVLPTALLPVPPVPGPLPSGASAPKPIGSPAAWFGPDAYPPAAIRRHAQGRTVAALTIDAEGRVRDCRIAETSGDDALDAATCRTAFDRGRFGPAVLGRRPIAATYSLRVRWVLPEP